MLGTRERRPDTRERLDGRLLVEAKPLVGGTYLTSLASTPHLVGDVIEPVV